MRTNSIAYRLLTISSIFGFVLTSIKTAGVRQLASADMSIVLYEAGRVAGNALIPAFLLWRNIDTLMRREPMIPLPLMTRAPWYYTVAVTGVWLQLAAQFLLPALAVVAGYSSVSLGLLFGNLSAAGLWFGSATLFLMEVVCAFHRGREPNNALQATCEDARA